MNPELKPRFRFERIPGTKADWWLKPGNIEDLKAALEQIEECEWLGPREGSGYNQFEAVRIVLKWQIKDQIRWAELVERSPWVRPLRVFFLWGVLVVPAVVMLIAKLVSAIAKYLTN